jgi:Transposase IS116/IS110/IS902 family
MERHQDLVMPAACSRCDARQVATPAARTRTGPVPAAPGQAQSDAQAPNPLDTDHLRSPVPGHRPLGLEGRKLLERLEIPRPWRETLDASLFTIAAEIGDINRFPSAKRLVGYTGLCPMVRQSGEKDRRGPLSKQGRKYLRWAMLEATMHALRHPAYRERYQRNKQRLGKQRGARVAQVDIARKLTEAVWHMLTNNQPFDPAAAAGGASVRLAA